jgi:hypothetical protein
VAGYDVKRERPGLYCARRGRFDLVDVPALAFLMVDGHGDPNTAPAYPRALTALYTASYAVRAVAKDELGRVHVVAPLEGLWSADDLDAFRSRDKAGWDWTLMITQPAWITGEVVVTALERARRAKGPEVVDGVRFEEFHEGLAVQTLHVGPYDDEGPVIARMHDEVLPAQGLAPRGRHHEIYLSDARRTDPGSLRTILRQPVAPATQAVTARGGAG